MTVTWIVALGCCQAVAGDTVEVAGAGGGLRRYTGRVLEYTGRHLLLELPNSTRQEIPGNLVLRVITDYAPQQVEADRLLGKGQFTQALPLYRRALSTETRDWVKRLILARMVWCFQGLGQSQPAGDAFLALVASDPSTPYFDCIPLAWITSEPSPLLQQTARQWLARNQRQIPAAVLLGASYLLPTAERPAALAKLKRLATSGDRRIGQLATAQIWRTAANPDDDQLQAWQRAIEQMDESLRAGPYFVMGRAYAARHKWEESALAMMRVPILYGQHSLLAARSLLETGRSLERLGRPGEAARLYRELLGSHAGTPAATEAQGRLEQMAGGEG